MTAIGRYLVANYNAVCECEAEGRAWTCLAAGPWGAVETLEDTLLPF